MLTFIYGKRKVPDTFFMTPFSPFSFSEKENLNIKCEVLFCGDYSYLKNLTV